MIQPKYNPKEALEKIKLNMKYDTSKTLNENKNVIFEQTVGRGIGSVAGTVIGVISVAAFIASIPLTGGMSAAMALASSTAMAAGGATGYGLGTLIEDWFTDESAGQNEFKRLMSFCASNPSGIEAIPRILDDSQAREIAYNIEDAKGQFNDDEDAIVQALKKIPSLSDLCVVNKRVTGGLYGFLDDLTNSPDEWKMFTRPVKDIIEDSKIEVKTTDPDCLKDPTLEKCKGQIKIDDGKKTDDGKKNGSGYTPCSGTYKYRCKTDPTGPIGVVQGCLGLVTDGKFGPKTRAALSEKGVTTFTDADVNKICEKQDVEQKLTSDVETQSLGGDQSGSSTSQSPDQESNTKTGIS